MEPEKEGCKLIMLAVKNHLSNVYVGILFGGVRGRL